MGLKHKLVKLFFPHHAPELADRLFPWAGLPTNFLVNAKGMRSGMVGVGDVDYTVARMESCK